MPSRQPIPLTIDETLTSAGSRGTPQDWTQRALYRGDDGADAWLRMMNAPSYGKNPHREAMGAQLLDAVRGFRARAFVSLGPGSGEPDVLLVTALSKGTPEFDYVPVDLNETFLQVAGTRMRDVARVPFGVLADFETAMPFIQAQLDKHGISPAVYGLLGSTLSNLDRGESRFVSALHDALHPEDAWLLEVATREAGWAFENDMRTQYASYAAGERRLIANGIGQRTGEPLADIERDFEARIRFREAKGEVPGASVIEAFDTRSGLVGLRNGRYDLSALASWLEAHGFRVEFKHVYAVAGFTLGMAALRLRKR